MNEAITMEDFVTSLEVEDNVKIQTLLQITGTILAATHKTMAEQKVNVEGILKLFEVSKIVCGKLFEVKELKEINLDEYTEKLYEEIDNILRQDFEVYSLFTVNLAMMFKGESS